MGKNVKGQSEFFQFAFENGFNLTVFFIIIISGVYKTYW